MKRPPKPLDSARLEELALHYVGRFATTRAKLRTYLGRKIRERGWDGERDPDVQALADRFAERGYVDDKAYAAMKGRDLAARGYGPRRVDQAFHAAGISEADGAEARGAAMDAKVASALKFAARRRLGPYANAPLDDPAARRRAVAAFARAGHDFQIASRIIDLPPGSDIDPEDLL